MSDPFNKEDLVESIDDDVEFLEETIEMLDEDSGDLLDACRAAATTGDAEALVKPAHALKGMVGNFCAEPAQEAARVVEFMGREKCLGEASAAVETLSQKVAELKTALHAFVEELKQ